MSSNRVAVAAAAAVLFAAVAPAPAAAQFGGLKERIKQKAAEKVSRQVEKRAEDATDRAIASGEKVIKCLVTDQTCMRKAKESGASVAVVSSSGAPVSSADSARAMSAAGAAGAAGAATSPSAPAAASSGGAGDAAWVNYDFVPGERVLFYDDFAADEVGNFPRRLQLLGGNMEIAEWRGGRWLRSTGNGSFAIPLPEVLPERFTLEMDVYHGARRNSWGEVTTRFVERPAATTPVVKVNWTNGGILAPGLQAMTDLGQEKFADQVVPIRVMADGPYVKVYMGDKRVANVPTAELGRARKIWVTVPASDESPAYVGPIRVAAGGRKLYDALAASGRVATHGVLFDTGSDVLRPESTPTLKEITAMLTEHPQLALTIEGHTDNAGDAAANQALSLRRAEAVKTYLASHGVDASRLAAAGFGAAKPVASNATAEGRQQNRRVELVKR